MTGVVDLSKAIPPTLFLSGIYTATFAASGIFFLKFWRKTHERFFYIFAWACWALALERVPLVWLDPDAEINSWIYLFRLTAFLLIILAIIRANRASKQG